MFEFCIAKISQLALPTREKAMLMFDADYPNCDYRLKEISGFHRLHGQHSRGGFTRVILGMAASVVDLTQEGICSALTVVYRRKRFAKPTSRNAATKIWEPPSPPNEEKSSTEQNPDNLHQNNHPAFQTA